MALLLVVLITYLFLQDWRATLIPSVAIPVALIGTFPFMLAIGYSINVLTMFGLILVIGSLCDDAIVVVENCQALMEREGLSPKEAAIKSMQQITGAIIATTLVTVACYAPLAFYGGMVGNIYMQFAVTMCISLCLSTVVAMTLSPALCACILRKPAEHPPLIFKPFNATLDASRKIYLFGVKLLVRRAILTVILFAGAMAAAYFLYEKLPSSFLPTEDKGAFMCNVELPPGATLARTESVLAELREHLKDVKGIKSNIMVSGFSFMNGNGENYGMAIVKLDPWDQRKTPELQLEAIQTEVQKRANEISAARIICFTPPAIMGLGVTGGATFMLSGDGEVNPAELSTTARKFALDLSALPETLYAMSTYNADTPQLYLDIDRKKAETLGVSTGTIYSTLQSKLASFYINDFNIMGNTFYVKMQSTGEYRVSQDDIMDIQIPNSSGEMVPLSSLATLRYIVGPQRIQRFNKYTSAEMNAQAAQGVSSSVLMNVIENMKLPSKYHIEWTGMSYQERLNQGQIVFLMMMAMLFAYLFLVAQYESWTIPGSRDAVGRICCSGSSARLDGSERKLEHLRTAWHGHADRACRQECDSDGGVFQTGTRKRALRGGGGDERRESALPRSSHDRMVVPVRRVPAGDCHRRRRRKPESNRHYDIFRYASGNADRDYLYARSLCRMPAASRVGESKTALEQKGLIRKKTPVQA